LKICFIGDIVGRPGRTIVIDILSGIRKEHDLDFVIANGENASGGTGLVPHNAETLLDAGIDFFTSGNHIFQNKEYEHLFASFPQVIRPANYPDSVPGKGFYTMEPVRNTPITVINIIGRTFMDPMDCPFKAIDKILDNLPDDSKIIIVDFHAEATSEKIAMGWYLNGRVSAMVGTHTHVQTSDERILSEGTAYITDVGMAGPMDSVIGVERNAILKRFLTGLPVRFTVAVKGPSKLDAVIIDVDEDTGKARSIERLSITRKYPS
jgi:metallophosphoesterase (TIGR00282 family)